MNKLTENCFNRTMIVYVITNCPRGIKDLRDHSGIIIKFERTVISPQPYR